MKSIGKKIYSRLGNYLLHNKRMINNEIGRYSLQ